MNFKCLQLENHKKVHGDWFSSTKLALSQLGSKSAGWRVNRRARTEDKLDILDLRKTDLRTPKLGGRYEDWQSVRVPHWSLTTPSPVPR